MHKNHLHVFSLPSSTLLPPLPPAKDFALEKGSPGFPLFGEGVELSGDLT